MKKLFVSIAAMTMLLATGCQNEELVQQGNTGDYTLTLDMGAQSRTMHDENGNCVWGENEAIYVVGEGGKVFGTLTMKSKSEDGKKAVFSGKVTGDPAKLQFMVYPVPEADGTIPMGNIDGTNHNAPMTGSISGGVVEDVDYAGGLLKVPVSGVDDMKVSAKGEDKKIVTGGSYTFNPATGELTFDPNGGTPVIIENVSNTNGFVYVPVDTDADKDATNPDNQTESVTVEITVGEGNNENSQSFDTEIQEGAITTEGVPSVDVDESGEIILSVGTEAQLRAALAAGGEVELTSNIEIGEKALTIAKDKVVHLNLKGFALTSGSIVNNGTLTIDSDSLVIVNACNFTLTGDGEVGITGGVYVAKPDAELIKIGRKAMQNANEGKWFVIDEKFDAIATSSTEVNAAIFDKKENILLASGKYTVDLYSKKYETLGLDVLNIIGTKGTQVEFSNLQVRAELVNQLTIDNCEILRMPDKSWGHLVFGSSNNAKGVYTVSNCTFNGKVSQGIYINETVAGAVYNILNCTFNGNFGTEGAVTIQAGESRNVAYTVNVKGCTFNNIPSTSHKIAVLYTDTAWTLNTDVASNDIYWRDKTTIKQ